MSATGTPRSNSTVTISAESGASSGRVTSWNTSSSGAWSSSSIQRPSLERPHRLSSIEYGATSVPPLTGIPCSRAYATSSSRPILHPRTGAITRSSGPSVATVASIRTWSLPLPVQPCAIVSQPLARAYFTASLAISGRPSAVNSG